MTKLHFNYKDIFRAFRLGFSAKKIWVAFEGLLLAWVGFVVFGYLAHLASGTSPAAVWQSFRLLPMATTATGLAPFNVGGWILWAVGIVWLVFAAMITGVTITKLTYEQLKGDEFYEVKEAWKQGFRSAGSLVATPILLALFVVLLLAAGLLLGLIGRIPYAGEMVVGILAIPAFAVALFIVYLFIVLLFTFSIGPAVIGTTRSDAFDNLFEVFSCVNDQPWRLIWYQFMLVVFAVVGTLLFAFFAVKAAQLGRWIVGVLMNVGEAQSASQVLYKLDLMINAAGDSVRVVLPTWCAAMWDQIFYAMPPFLQEFLRGFGASASPSVLATSNVPIIPTWSMMVGTVLFSITYHVLILVVLGYGLTIWFSGNTLVYLVLVKKKDERNLLEIKDEEIEVPEKLEATVPPATEPEKKPKKKTTGKKTTGKKGTPKKTTGRKGTGRRGRPKKS